MEHETQGMECWTWDGGCGTSPIHHPQPCSPEGAPEPKWREGGGERGGGKGEEGGGDKGGLIGSSDSTMSTLGKD